ncbi:radical SAM protein [Clostridium polynesiense]|uniref:radical SAM protein n=1 Tax=Clostridium polynesiense TaxID=1325933 RepID=UPI00058DDF7C|nr:radical SAM protein [Clostridium polynesiense]
MKNKISVVKPNSIAMELGIENGDRLVSVNGNEVKDIIDYKFLMTDEYLEIEIEKQNGELWSLEIEKDYDEDFGVEFETAIMDKARSCSNKCIFCFIDQLPKGMRKSLYFKDDDSRLSFLQGNFVTLTNMNDDDIDRIIKYRISPINVSVHTTNPELRKKILNNRFAGNVYERLERLAEAGTKINAQIVTVPGINNGDELIKTVEDLYKLYPGIENVAAVPVGITKYREGLSEICGFNKITAKEELINIKALQDKYIKEIGRPFIRLSDEFYVLAEEELPEKEFYGDFHQLEDGVGMIRILRENIKNSLELLDLKISGELCFITGDSAYKEIRETANIIMNRNDKIQIKVLEVINHFFGETITVAGLLTGKDIINSLKLNKIKGNIIIPRNMLRAEDTVFLDDITVEDIEKTAQGRVIIVDYTGEDLIDKINHALKEE